MIFAALTLAVAVPAAGAPSLDGIRLGDTIATAIRARGNPQVENTAVGHVWTFEGKDRTLRLVSDDSGIITIVDVRAVGDYHGSVTMPLLRSFSFGEGGHVNAQSAAGTNTKPDIFTNGMLVGKPATFLGYRLGGARELILAFDGPGEGGMREAFLGTRAALAITGLIPGNHPRYDFKAPSIKTLGGADFVSMQEGTAYVRIEVGADGKATGATIFVGSGSSELDRVALANARFATFTPATLDGKPVPSVYFRREDFAHVRPR